MPTAKPAALAKPARDAGAWETSEVQLGDAGKEGTVMLVRRKGAAVGAAGEYAAMKVFKKGKSAKAVLKEAAFQAQAAAVNAAPPVLASALLRLYALLDGVRVLHNDSNPANIMVRGRGADEQWRLIDFGFSKKITKAHGASPNVRLSLRFLLHGRLGLVSRGRFKAAPAVLLDALEAANRAHAASK
eukprot:g3232.t1